MLQKHFFLFLLLISFTAFCQKTYQKKLFKNGQIKEEGWLLNNQKNEYWKFYYKNGNLKKEGLFKDNLETNYWYFYSENSIKEKEGHFKEGQQNDWWLFYDKNGQVIHKCQLENNRKNGYCLIYQDGKLIKASKFKKGKKINEWKDFSSFKKENTLSDLR